MVLSMFGNSNSLVKTLRNLATLGCIAARMDGKFIHSAGIPRCKSILREGLGLIAFGALGGGESSSNCCRENEIQEAHFRIIEVD